MKTLPLVYTEPLSVRIAEQAKAVRILDAIEWLNSPLPPRRPRAVKISKLVDLGVITAAEAREILTEEGII